MNEYKSNRKSFSIIYSVFPFLLLIFLILVASFALGSLGDEIQTDNNVSNNKQENYCNREEENYNNNNNVNNVNFLISFFVFIFETIFEIISFVYRVVYFCLYPVIYIFQTFYNIFIYKPYRIIRWILSTFYPLMLFFSM